MPIDYVVKRTLQLLLIVFIAVTVNFGIPRLIPGDPVESALQTKMAMTGNANVDVQAVAAAYRAKFGLDKPLWQQYLNYWVSIFTRDLGVSLVDFPQPVIEKIQSRGALDARPADRLDDHLVLRRLDPGRADRLAARAALPALPGAAVHAPVVGAVLPAGHRAAVHVLGDRAVVPAGRRLRSGARSCAPICRPIVDILYHAILPALALVLGSIGFWALGCAP